MALVVALAAPSALCAEQLRWRPVVSSRSVSIGTQASRSVAPVIVQVSVTGPVNQPPVPAGPESV
jgi:hypothetical protein